MTLSKKFKEQRKLYARSIAYFEIVKSGYIKGKNIDENKIFTKNDLEYIKNNVMNKINTKEASENYWKERVKNNDYSDKERNDYFLCRYVNYDGVKLNIKKIRG